ncbi:MAG: LacI family transcriptional regulator [Clostridiales bacterium]|nr:LacI family transcriptional regulator [Clostridiales bacterium]
MKRFSKITTTQLARICGVSQGTVDRALHDRGDINPQTKEKILSIAREYDYTPSLKNQTDVNSMLIGVVLFDLYNEFFSTLAMNLVNIAKKSGYSILFQFSNKNIKDERNALEYFDYIGVDGIILFSVGSDSEEYKNYLKSIKKPLVLIGNPMFDLPFIGIDNTKAMYDLTTILAQKINTDTILYYSPILNKKLNSTNAQNLRLQGFISACTYHGKQYKIITDLNEIDSSFPIVCSTDYYALQVLSYLNYPTNITIAGCDNTSLFKSLQTPIISIETNSPLVAQQCINYILGKKYLSKIEYQIVDNSK